MADPTTSNIALAVPTRGSDPGTWDTPVNGDFNSLDGMLGGVATIGLSNANVSLTAPAGSITPSPGPTQSQNAVLKLTGALTGNVQITLPLPGFIIIDNQTTGAFVVTFRAIGSGQVIAVDQGVVQHIYNDGSNVRFSNLGQLAHIEMWAGLSALPAWVNACTVPPYLLNDGSVHNVSDFPALGARLGGQFGGNGITTFGVPDHRGRMAIPYDGTGTRITTAGSGLNGQLMGASLDQQSVALTSPQLPANIPQNLGFTFTPSSGGSTVFVGTGIGSVPTAPNPTVNVPIIPTPVTLNGSVAITSGSINPSGGGSHNNVQPSQVTGISVIKT